MLRTEFGNTGNVEQFYVVLGTVPPTSSMISTVFPLRPQWSFPSDQPPLRVRGRGAVRGTKFFTHHVTKPRPWRGGGGQLIGDVFEDARPLKRVEVGKGKSGRRFGSPILQNM